MKKFGVQDKKSSDTNNTIISKDTHIQGGRLISKSPVQVEGIFEGEVEITDSLTVGESGEIIGNVEAENVLVAGRVNGNILAGSQLQITSTGKVVGDVISNTLIIDEGATLEGACRMGQRASFTEPAVVN